jgi:hypothetical protein
MELTIRVGGDLGTISVRAWSDVLTATLKLIEELDHSNLEGPERDWVVTGLSQGSLVLRVAPTNMLSEAALPRVLETVKSLQSAPAIPPGATEATMKNVIKIGSLIGRRGITSIEFSDKSDKLAKVLPFTPQISVNAQAAIRGRTRSISSFRGRLDKISVRSKRPQFSLFDETRRVALRCVGEDGSLIDAIKEGLGKQVSAHGELSRNDLGQPVHMVVDRIRLLDEPARLVRLEEIAGIDPDWTTELSSVEFVRRQRERSLHLPSCTKAE